MGLFFKISLFSLFIILGSQSCDKAEMHNEPISKREALDKLQNSLRAINRGELLLSISKAKGSENTNNEYVSILAPLLNTSRIVLNAYEIDYEHALGSKDNPTIIFTALLLLTLESEFDKKGPKQASYALAGAGLQYTKGVWDCGMEALGAAAVAELIAAIGSSASIQASSALILRAAGRIAIRYAGWIGAAVMIADFTECMITGD